MTSKTSPDGHGQAVESTEQLLARWREAIATGLKPAWR